MSRSHGAQIEPSCVALSTHLAEESSPRPRRRHGNPQRVATPGSPLHEQSMQSLSPNGLWPFRLQSLPPSMTGLAAPLTSAAAGVAGS
jgi:hypothetical protein